MCGIFGTVNLIPDNGTLKRELHHRGPDEFGTHSWRNVELRHFRLAIQAIQDGHQPLALGNDLVTVYNGEIYNNLAIRNRYNLACKTNSDTETLVRLWAEHGIAGLEHVDGMFAFAMLDKRSNRLHLVRDRAGKKPLYIYNDGQKLVFASELNSIARTVPLQISDANLRMNLRFGYNVGQRTPYEQVTELLPGHHMTVDLATLQSTTVPWWLYSLAPQDDSIREEDALEQLNLLLREAVETRLASSDLQVGSFLSGGIDSGIVTAIAAEMRPGLPTFTVRFDGAFDESELATQVSQHLQTRHHTIDINFDHLGDEVESILASYGEPLYDSSAIPSHYVSREAKRYVTVALNGDGADELFGGYRRYVTFRHFNLWEKHALRRLGFLTLSKVFPASHLKSSRSQQFERLANLTGDNVVETFLSATSDIFEGTVFAQELLIPRDILHDFNQVRQQTHTPLQSLMAMDFLYQLPGDLLVKMDIATMASSLEGRSPFLCHKLLNYAPTLPEKFKISGLTTKSILRKLAARYLPKTILTQPKRGFEVPLLNWTEHQLKQVIFDYLQPSSFVSSIFDFNHIEALKSNNLGINREKRAKMLWTLFATEVWHRQVVAK